MEKLPEESKFYVKFSKNIVLLESFLKQKNISYEKSELEDTPLGRGYVVKRDNLIELSEETKE